MNVLKELQSKVSGKLVKSDRNITKLSNQQKEKSKFSMREMI